MSRQLETDATVKDHKVYDELMEILDNSAAHQENILARILRRNAKAEYLLKYKLDGATDVKSFREKIPISEYDDYTPFLDRILEGDRSPLLAGEPPIEMLSSSGTSKGALKLLPATNEELVQRRLVDYYSGSIAPRFIPEAVNRKCLALVSARQGSILSCGLPCRSYSASAIANSASGIANAGNDRRQRKDPRLKLMSPLEVLTSADPDAGLYCHLLLGLVQRDEVGRILSFFPAVFIKAMRCLEEWWPEICDDIATGTLSTSRVRDEALRAAVLSVLRKDLDLAEILRSLFSSARESSWDRIVPKIWPNMKAVDITCSGSMEPYFATVSKYAGDVPVISTMIYVSTEGSHAVNLDPMCPANKTRYTFFPAVAYYEFIPVAGEYDSSQLSHSGPGEVLDLMSVKEGHEYEILITTISGLYRYKIGDILKVVGHYKSTPLFQLRGRANMTLSIDTDKTEEKDLYVAFMQGSQILEAEIGLSVQEYTSTVDYSSKPAHYVIFCELNPSSNSAAAVSSISLNPSDSVLAKCCTAMEAPLGEIYRRGRFENIIGPMEIRLVQEGTFDLLCKDAMSRGTSFPQYKTPRVMKSNSPGLDIMKSRVTQSVFSQEKPPYNPVNTEPGKPTRG